nr:hypothetical protein [Tanacetum cinerariifolium]
MTTLAEFMILSGADNRPLMLEKHLYDSWKSRMELYMQNREHERMILEAVEHGPPIWPTIEENGVTRTKRYEELFATVKIQADCDLKATNIILQGLPTDVYYLVNHHRVTKDLWERVQLLMQEKFQVNTNFLNSLPPEWSKFVTDVKLCLKPKRKKDATWFRDKVLLVEAQGSGKVLNKEELEFLADLGVAGLVTQTVITHNAAYQADDLDAYDFDCDDFSTAKAVLMANLSSYEEDVLSEVLENQLLSVSLLICLEKHDCVERIPSDPEQAFVEHASSRIDKAGGLVSNFMASQDASLSKFEADFKQQQSEMTNKIYNVLKAITDQMAGTPPSDTVKNPKLTQSMLSRHILRRQPFPKQACGDPRSKSNRNIWKNPNQLLKMNSRIYILTYQFLRVLAHTLIYNAILDKYVEILELGKNGSAFVQGEVPAKMEDPGLFTLPCRLGESKPFDTLADLGSCVNIIPLYLLKNLNIRILEETNHICGLADGTKSYPVGIMKDVEVHIGKLKVLDDFYVIDMKKDPETPLLVRRGFLATPNVVIDYRMAKIAVEKGITRSVFEVKGVDLDFDKRFVPQKELSDEQAFWLQNSHPNTDQSASLLFKIKAPRELPKNNTSVNQTEPSFDQLFELNNLKAELQAKDTTIEKLKANIKCLNKTSTTNNVKKDIDEIETINIELEHRVTKLIVENEHLKQTYKQLYDLIKPSRVQAKEHAEPLVLVITALKNNLRKFKGKDIVDNAAQVSNETTIALGMYKLDRVTLAPKDKNNRKTHIYYLKHTIEQAAILREIVKQAKSLNPLDSASYSAYKYVKLIQELLGYVRDTFPDIHKSSEKLVAVSPINKKKTVRFTKPVISSGTSQKQLGSSQTKTKQTTNISMSTSTGVSRSTKSSRSKSTDNTKNDRILQISSSTDPPFFLRVNTNTNVNT